MTQTRLGEMLCKHDDHTSHPHNPREERSCRAIAKEAEAGIALDLPASQSTQLVSSRAVDDLP